MKPYFFFFFLCQLISGQSFEGKVLDYETRAPLENVHIYLLNSARGTITNHVGEYSITTTGNTHLSDTLQFSIIGYASLKISFSMLQDSGFQTLLTRQNEKLDPINLNSRTKLNSSLKFTKMAPLDLGVYSFGSIIIGDQIYVLGGDASFLEDTFSEAVDKVHALMEPKFEDIQKKWRQNLSWEHYSDKLQIYNIETK